MFFPFSEPERSVVLLDRTPTFQEEEELFASEIEDVTQWNAKIDGYSKLQDIEERRVYSDRAFGVTKIWVRFLVYITLFQMLLSIFGFDGLSDGKFITVVTTTTASVFGFWVLVGRYLFPNNKNQD